MSTKKRAWTLKTVRDRCTIDESTDDPCWLWKQSLVNGRPQATIDGRGGTLVARWVMQQRIGNLISRYCVVNRCDDLRCINPDHLTIRTRSQVLKLAYQSGARNVFSEYLARRTEAEKRGMAKIDMGAARNLRQRMCIGHTIEALADETGLSRATLSKIKNGKIWREIGSFGNALGSAA